MLNAELADVTIPKRNLATSFCILFSFSTFPSNKKTGAPNEKKLGKGLECSFLLSHIVLWPFKGFFMRANIISSVRMR